MTIGKAGGFAGFDKNLGCALWCGDNYSFLGIQRLVKPLVVESHGAED